MVDGVVARVAGSTQSLKLRPAWLNDFSSVSERILPGFERLRHDACCALLHRHIKRIYLLRAGLAGGGFARSRADGRALYPAPLEASFGRAHRR